MKKRFGLKVLGLVMGLAAAVPLMVSAQWVAGGVTPTVTSASIYAADNTTGQTLTTGNGVKTGHIQNGAITNAKFFGNISGSKISTGAITASEIAAGAVGTAALAPLALANGNIATGAVTDAKISGTISGTKLGAHSHAATDITGSRTFSGGPQRVPLLNATFV